MILEALPTFSIPSRRARRPTIARRSSVVVIRRLRASRVCIAGYPRPSRRAWPTASSSGCALRGQNNVQGCGDAGCIPTNLPGDQHYTPETLERFERAWGVRPPARAGRVVTEMVEGRLTGDTRAMYVVGENPLLSEPDLHHAEKAIGQLAVLVVQDLFIHETAERAHVFLPAPTS